MRLVICEKGSAAKRIAHILSKGSSSRKIGKVPVYFFDRANKKHTVIGLKGHLMGLDFPAAYTNWDKVKPSELVGVEPEYKVLERNIIRALERLARDLEEVIIATDFDREGELIGVEALNILKKFSPQVKVRRARFSSLVKEEIEKSFKNLTDIDERLATAAMARQHIDLIWGAVLTRSLSLAAGQRGDEFLSAGRVQTPTLGLLVDREKQISEFVPKPYWKILALLSVKDEKFEALHTSGKIWEKTEAQALVDKCKGEALVLRVARKKRVERPPAPFNTTSFIRAATKLGLSARRAMYAAEQLYRRGLISYPRTDNTVYPKQLDFRSILRKLVPTQFGEYATQLLAQKKLKPTRGGREAKDHPPIHPVGVAKKLEKFAYRVYELVVRRFFATLAPACLIELTRVEVEIGTQMFYTTGYHIAKPGWRRYYPYGKKKEKILPPLKEGDAVKVLRVNLEGNETKPPKRYSQGALIAEMEARSLGTKSTRHEILGKLYSRRYIGGRALKPMRMGATLIEALRDYAKPITEPEMTRTLEQDMHLIAKGKKRFEEIVNESKQMLHQVMYKVEPNLPRIGEALVHALREQRKLGACRCGGDLIMLKSRKGKRFVGCTNYPACKNSYPLPQKGRIIPLNELCKKCGAPRIRYIGKRRRDFCINPDCN